MKLDSNLYIHDSDKAALAALKAIPGFDQVVKAFMKLWNERQYKLINMSTNLRLSDNQLAKYYHLLPPICEKLGIDIPELYVKLDVNPNAYTYGDNEPFIVMTSGLFETMPEELIPTVIAHECGHIACHHTLYRTMGGFLINTASDFVTGLGSVALYPIRLAFAYWMRCSELSADRAAAICDGNTESVTEMCMRFAGYDKDIMDDANIDEFLRQGEAYRELTKESGLNKTMEFLMFQMIDHPLNAVRALESREWGGSERFKVICEYINSTEEDAEKILPVFVAVKKYVGKNIQDVCKELSDKGLVNVKSERVTEVEGKNKDGTVLSMDIDGKEDFAADWIKRDTNILLKYYEAKTEEEIALEHIGEIKIGRNSKSFQGLISADVEKDLEALGFRDIELKEMALPVFGLFSKENTVAKIIIDGKDSFDESAWFNPDVKIVVFFYVKV